MAFTISIITLFQTGCEGNDDPIIVNSYLTLGVVLPMDQEKGTLRENALRTAIDEINEAGGVGNGYEIRLNVKSSEGADRKVAAALAAEEIIMESNYLVGFISCFSSSSTGIVEEIGIPEQYPIISGAATASSLSGVSTYFQRLCSPDSFEANVLAQQTVEYGITNVAIAVEDGDEYSEELATAFQNAFGAGAATKVNFKAGDPNYISKIDQLLINNPEAIFVSMLNSEEYTEFFTALGNIYSSAKMADVTYILCDALYTDELFSAPIDIILGEINDHPRNFGAFPSADTSSTEYKYFAESLFQKYDQEVASYNAQYYDIGYLYALAMQKSLADVETVTIDIFREMVANEIRPISNEVDGDTKVSPSQGWLSMKTISKQHNINYTGASGNCDIDNHGNAITPYSVFKVVKQEGEFSFEIIKIIP